MPAPHRDEVLDGRYRLEELLGEGGMGLVHRATDLRLERAVAIKVVRADEEATMATRERFLREARRTAQVRHPNIVEVFDVGETAKGELYFVMERLEGESLAGRLTRGRLTLASFSHIAPQICDAIGAAHQAGVIHRDLKPANVMLVRHGSKVDHVKVLDFGISKAADSNTNLTAAGVFVGTVEYMAPEQIMGAPLDARADVYSLGALFYRLLTGTQLYPNARVATMLYHHLEVMPEAPRSRAPGADIPIAVEQLILRCLAKEPSQRLPSAIELGRALDQALAAKPAAAKIAVAKVEPKAFPTTTEVMDSRPLSAGMAASAEPGAAPAAPIWGIDTIKDVECTFAPPPRAPRAVSAPPEVGPSYEQTAELEIEIELDAPPRRSEGSTRPASAQAGRGATRPARRRRTLPSWIEPLGVLPIPVAKRVVLLSAIAAILLRIFMEGGGIYAGVLLVISALAWVGIYVRRRMEESAG